MNDSMERARQAARKKLLELGCCFESPPDADAAAQAAAAYIRSLEEDGDCGYLAEIRAEGMHQGIGGWAKRVADALDSNEAAHYQAAGENEANSAYSYLSLEIDMVISELPTWADLHADDYDEDYQRELRATA